jgi:DNA-binding NarL/FixJ family response regulator
MLAGSPPRAGVPCCTLCSSTTIIFRQGLKYLLADLNPASVFFEAGSSGQALAFVGAAPIGLVPADLQMPGANGMEAPSAMRAVPA